MTGKELLYTEDVLGHLEQMQTICDSYATKLQDNGLKEYVRTLSVFNQNLKTQFMSLLKGGANNG